MYSPWLCVQGSHTKHTMSQTAKSKQTNRTPRSKGARRSPAQSKRGPRREVVTTVAPAAYGFSKRLDLSKRLRHLKVSHIEPILTISGITTSAVYSVSMNPGLSAFTPWLAGIAPSFESYRIESLRFHYVTRAGSTKTGRVVLAVDYDALDAAPASFLQVSNYEDAVPTSSWESTTLTCRRSNLQKVPERFIRGEASIADQDLRLSDIGNLFIWVEGQDNTDSIGDVYVEYDIVLMTPQLAESSFGVYGGSVTGGGTLTAAAPYGSAPTADGQNRGFTVSGSTITIKVPGTYLVTGHCAGTVMSDLSLAVTNGSRTALWNAVVNGASTAMTRTYAVIVTSPNCVLTWTATATTVTSSNLYVASMPVNSHPLAAYAEHVGSCPLALLSKKVPPEVADLLCTCRGKAL